jgi:hypothetical protein
VFLGYDDEKMESALGAAFVTYGESLIKSWHQSAEKPFSNSKSFPFEG